MGLLRRPLVILEFRQCAANASWVIRMAFVAAIVRNRLLAGMAPEIFDCLRPHLRPISLKQRTVLQEHNRPIEHVFFLERGVASLFARTQSDGPVAVSIVVGFAKELALLATNLIRRRKLEDRSVCVVASGSLFNKTGPLMFSVFEDEVLRSIEGVLVPAGLERAPVELVLEQLVAAPSLRASLNVSAASTIDPDWWSALAAMLRANSGIAERLMVEITETTSIQDIDETRGFVARVKDLGCRIAIDDFGAGYTSFRNLRRLGVDVVKIDGAFVQNLTRSEDDRAFVHTLIDLARRLGLQTVAEWVQDEQAASILAGWGCDYLQGALVGLATTDRPWLEAPGATVASA